MIKEKLSIIPIVPAKQCSDFDEDCAEVEDHLACWNNWQLGIADGYCPYLMGQKK